ncbi:MAG: DUF1800 family protein [Luteolibacter sp.]
MQNSSIILALAWPLAAAAIAAPGAFVTPESEFRLGESVMVPLRLDAPAEQIVHGTLTMNRPGIVEILREPEFLAGHEIGFARIRTLAPGAVVLRNGESTMRVNVTTERPLSLVRQMRPRFTSPSENSAVWGTVAIGAEMWVGAPGVDRMAAPDAKLRLPDGRELVADESFPPVDGPFWRLVFHLDTTTLPPGESSFTISAKPPIEGAGNADLLTSETHTLLILPPPGDDDLVFSGECEDALGTPRSERMGSEPPGVVMAPDASGFRAVALRRRRPAWVIQPEIPEPGRYQLLVRARGTIAGAAYPSLGIVLGEDASDSMSVRLASADWHNVPVGRPLRLDAGPQWIGISLANEFNYRNQIQRVADIDRYELRRIPDDAGSGDAGMMMAGGMMMTAGKPENGATKNRADRLRVAFTSIVDGDSIRSRTTLNATLRSPSLRNERDYARIRSDLWINGRVTASAHGQNPSFTVHPHDFKAGENTLQIHAVSPCGNQALSLSQALQADSPTHPSGLLDTTFNSDRYDLQRGAWHQVERIAIGADHPLAGEGAPERAHPLKPGRAARFDLPRDLQGKRRISIHTRAIPDAAPGIVAVTLHQPEARPRALREIQLPRHTAGADWDWHALASIDLTSGRKWLTFELIEGEATLAGCGIDTEVFVDAAPPNVEILYPKPNAALSADGDAIVIRTFDDLALSRFELFIDGEKAPLPYPAGNGTGSVLLHIPGSLLESGKRSIEIAAIDESGKTTRSAAVRVEVRRESDPELTLPYPRAVRLAKNLALGLDPRTVAEILTHGESAWLESQLDAASIADAHIEALGETWFRDISDYNIRGRVAADLLATRFPVRARFAMFAQNHFSTWISKTGADAKWREHQAFRDVGPARFQDLLLTSATSPAMMVYLDQQSSFGRQLNENYAREVMELHTVGVHAGYDQDDVIHLAKLLSGWGAQRESTMDGTRIGYEYRYSPYLAEPGPLEVFGLSIPAAGTPDTADDRVRMAIEMLASRPQTARFIAEKMVGHYLGLPADESTVAALESEFLHSGGNLRRMLTTLATSPRMMAVDRAKKILPPVEFAVATQRAAVAFHPWSVIDLADRSGRNLFDRASPDGFPESNDEYADSNYQLQKWRFCKQIEWQLRGGIPGPAFHVDALADASRRDALIDFAYATRHGGAPSTTSRDALHQILSQEITDENQRRNLFSTFLHMTPEFQSR